MSGKNVSSGAASCSGMSAQGNSPATPGAVLPCAKPKHWIGIKVEDEGGTTVKDERVHCKLDDGTSFTVDMATATLESDGSFKTKKVLDAAKCDFSFPGLHNIEWWPKGEKPGSGTVAAASALKDGECLLTLADQLGFRHYHSIWDQAQNAEIKNTRPNPNMLLNGDVFNAPDKQDKVVNKPVDNTWTFVVRTRKPFTVRMILIDADDAPLAGKNWELKTPAAQKGTTAKNGLIEITVLKPSDLAGTLEVEVRQAITPPAKPAPAPVTSPPPYPPAIVSDDYKDKMPALDLAAKIAHWDLKPGALPPAKTKQGALVRLHNLGFACDADSHDDDAAKAVKAYQRLYFKNKNGSGRPADVEDDAAKRHDIA
jgi:hypothetical protein